MNDAIEVTTLAKHHGSVVQAHPPRPRRGKLVSDGSACVMGTGDARRTKLPDMAALAAHIAGLGASEAIALGRLHPSLPGKVQVVTKAKLEAGNGAQDIIARIFGEFIDYTPGAPALLLIDVDTKGMPDSVRARVEALGGAARAIASVVPELKTCGSVLRNSTTTGLSRADTGEALPGSEGRHLYILVQDGATTSSARCARCTSSYGWPDWVGCWSGRRGNCSIAAWRTAWCSRRSV